MVEDSAPSGIEHDESSDDNDNLHQFERERSCEQRKRQQTRRCGTSSRHLTRFRACGYGFRHRFARSGAG